MEINQIKLTKEEFDKGRILYPNNNVIVEMEHPNEEKKTKSGVIVGFNRDVNYAEGNENHVADVADVCGIVVKVPEKYYFSAKEQKSPSWRTNIEVEVGDKVWFSPFASVNCEELVVEDKVYKIIAYEDLFVAKRPAKTKEVTIGYGVYTPEQIICLNGNVILEPVYKESLGSLDVLSEQEIDQTRGRVKFVGSSNLEYCDHTYADFQDLQVGDLVLLDKRIKPIPLERKVYNACFDDDNLYYTIPRRFITMVIPNK